MSERKLTEAEARRKQAFEVLETQMKEQGYGTEELRISAFRANVFAVIISAPVWIGFLVLFLLLHGNPFSQDYNGLLFILAMFVGIIVHELIHGLTWSMYTQKGWKSIEFGIIWKYATPYCTCNEPMKKGPMIVAAIMPTIVLGILPAVLAIATGKWVLLLFAIVLIIGGGGDMMIILNILKYRSKTGEVLFLDHPYEIGTIVFEKMTEESPF